jgi:hypothetical protein
MRLLLVALAGLLTVNCSTSQPGCSLENCRVMADACRVEFSGVTSYCYTNNTVPPGTDFAQWCVQACNARPANGQLAQCVADHAGACRAALDGGQQPEQVISSCLDTTAKGPQKACDDQCMTTRLACDVACSGGRPCDNCRRAGQDCTGLCPDAGFSTCADCSIQCALRYFDCSDACPRE